ncbi:MAG TPA: hypothetical protein P5556_09380 [Candidatus Gastranaerophilales bacterium]|nr:hypothetical protein [Candidatus Gastranaerophilales bacterium]
MNKNEECLLKFLEQPGRLDKTTEELKRFIFSVTDNIIVNDNIITKDFFLTENKPA